jgi:carboxyl-terminal processing protease
MKSGRLTLLIASSAIVLVLVGGGLGLRVGAADGSYGQVVVFSEILALVMDNYVDPVDTDGLLSGAYEGMLGGLDQNGAYLSPDEVAEWKAAKDLSAGPGLDVLKMFGTIQVVAVDPGSPADRAGVVPGDQVRSIDGRTIRDLSIDQVIARLRGAPGSQVLLGLLRPSLGFERDQMEVARATRASEPWSLEVIEGTAVLKVRDVGRVSFDELSAALAEQRERGTERLLIDLRNVVHRDPRSMAELARALAPGAALELHDRAGKVLETVSVEGQGPAWSGRTGVLVNGFTAGAAEALAVLLHDRGDVELYGESTFGMGAEPRLFELPDGSGLLFSAAVWKTAGGEAWNEDGIEPDHEIEPEGDDFEQALADQLKRTLEAFGAADEAVQDKAA